jgi:hypothetical protein
VTWTYRVEDLESDSDAGRLARIRLLVGDVDSSQKLTTRRLEDEEIRYYMSRWGTDHTAALEAGEALLARLSRTEIGTVQNVQGQRFEQITKNVERLREWVRAGIGPVATGQSEAEKRDADADYNRPASAFARGMFDNPLAPQPEHQDAGIYSQED